MPVPTEVHEVSAGKPADTMPQAKPSRTKASYPTLRIPVPGEVPIELFIYAKMPLGSAEVEMRQSHAYQLAHETFTDEFFEASAKVFNTSFQFDEKTAVYTFLVGKQNLQFHSLCPGMDR